MATNILSDGDIVTSTAPVGGFTSGTPIVMGKEILVPLVTVAAGIEGACQRTGVIALTFKVGDTWATQGLAVYFNSTTGECEAADTSSNYLIGSYDGSYSATKIKVVLPGALLAGGGGDLDAKADKAVPVAAHTLAALTGSGNLETSSILTADAVTNATGAASGADIMISSAGATKAVKSSGVAVANIPTMAANGGVGEFVYTAAADKALAKSGYTSASFEAAGAVTTHEGGTLHAKASVSTTGLQSAAVATKTGDGDMTSTKTGTPKRTGNFEVEITTGGELGASKFRWRCSRIAANAWQDNTGVGYTTDASVSLTTDAAVDTGVTVQFTAGDPGDDHDLGDKWTFIVTHEATIDGKHAVRVTFDLITAPSEMDDIVLNHTGITSASVVIPRQYAQAGTATNGDMEFSMSTEAAGKTTLRYENVDVAAVNGTFITQVLVVP